MNLPEYTAYALNVADIFVDHTFNCRAFFDVMSVAELAESIKEIGLQSPIIVQRYGDRYRLLAGHRRFKAVVEILGWTKIPAIVRNVTEHQARLLNLTENLERRNLNVVEEAQAIKNMFPDGSLRTIAAELKRPTMWVGKRLQLLNLPEEVQKMFAAGQVAVCHIPEVAASDDPLRAAKDLLYHKKIRKPWQRGHRKTREEISTMIAQLFTLGKSGILTRGLAWTEGIIDDEQFLKEATE